MKPRFSDTSMRFTGSFGRTDQFGGYRSGCVVTQHGIVYAYSQREDPHTRLDFALNGTLHMRQFKRYFKARGLATKAGQFAKEISQRNDLAGRPDEL